MMTPALFTPLKIRGTNAKNRIVISPMCQYSATIGMAQDWHFVHLGRFALGGAGIVFVEATAVSPGGRITHGDMGLWNDAQAAPLAHIAQFLRTQGALPAIQLAHAGRKASARRPWEGGGPLKADDHPPDEPPWQTVAPSAVPLGENWPTPAALDAAGLEKLRGDWRAATIRARRAGFEIVELHYAHGYLMNAFLSPLANVRNDAYGGTLQGRMRFPLEIAEIVRGEWPEDKPVFVRVSAVDDSWGLEDTVAFARELKGLGIDVIDCSSGGGSPHRPLTAEPGYQVPYAAQVRADAGIATMAVGLITEAHQAEAIIAEGKADLVAIAREALADPQWALHAQRALSDDPLDFGDWPVQVGPRLRDRARAQLRQGPTLDEFALIANVFAPLAANAPGAVGLSDDVATFPVPAGQELVVTTDALTEGIHFLRSDPPELVARKALRVNLSDLAGKGAVPHGYLLALSRPVGVFDAWLRAFAGGLAADQAKYGVALVGGDTNATLGPLTLAVTALGLVAEGQIIRRSGARVGDGVYVTGCVGDAAGGLAVARGQGSALTPANREELLARYRQPEPRVALGPRLIGIAHAALDVSDGLIADLGHLAAASSVRFVVEAARVPLSAAVKTLWGRDALARAVVGGDDYEIAFAAGTEAEPRLAALARETGVAITCIGRVEAGQGVALLDAQGRALDVGAGGWRHF